MPQPVRFRTPAAGGGRTPVGVGARAVLRAGLRSGLRALVGVVLCGGALVAHAQQETSGQIYIAGPGDRTGSDAASMTAMIQAPTNARASLPAPAAVAAPARPAVPAGMISIPGPGERGAAQAANDASAPQVITIPGPGERDAANGASVPRAVTVPGAVERAALPASAMNARVAQPAAAALPRENVVSAASRVASVVVGAQQPASESRTAAAPVNRAVAVAAATQRAGAYTAAAPAAQPAATASQPVPSGQQDGETVRAAALAYLQQQSAGLPGRVSITVSPVFPRGLAACASLEPFMPPGARMWGRTTVGVRCIGERPWTLYVQARVAVQVTYYTAGRPIAPGDTLAATDLQPRDGDLASLPRTVITDPSQAIGAVSLARIAAGLPLRTDMLRSASAVVIGQTVKLVAAGPNFTISTEGSALNNAAPGQRVQVRTSGGQIVSGVVKDAGTVEVQI